MKFDIIIGNPPYQKPIGERKTKPIWNDFVEIAFNYVETDGYVCLIHPNGWRDVSGPFDNIKQLLLSKNIEYMEFHNVRDSKKNFRNIQIMYDWYICKNSTPTNNTNVLFLNGIEEHINLNDLPFIPSGDVSKFKKLLAKEGEEKVNIIYDSRYHHQKPHMSSTKTSEFKYPCIWTIKSGDIVKLWYSNIDRGHFGTPKFIWGNGVCSSIGNIIDYNGDYGLTEFAYAIIDDVENLKNIKKCFDSKEFQNLMKLAPNRNNNYNRKVISLFKKDFWKYFI